MMLLRIFKIFTFLSARSRNSRMILDKKFYSKYKKSTAYHIWTINFESMIKNWTQKLAYENVLITYTQPGSWNNFINLHIASWLKYVKNKNQNIYFLTLHDFHSCYFKYAKYTKYCRFYADTIILQICITYANKFHAYIYVIIECKKAGGMKKKNLINILPCSWVIV